MDAGAGSDFWSSVGPYLMAGIAALVGVVWAAMREDIKWLKRNLTKVLVKLQIDPAEGE